MRLSRSAPPRPAHRPLTVGAWLTAVVVLAAGLVGPPAAAVAPAAAPATVAVAETRTNQSVDPLGIDDAVPALSWKLESSTNGSRQTAYEVQVASTADRLADGDADVWGTGKVLSPRSVGVDYGGPALSSGTRYHWRVRVWDQDDEPSAWSAAAWFETGLLQEDDWDGAEWISPAPSEEFDWTDYVVEADFSITGAAGGLVFRGEDANNFNMWQISFVAQTVRLRPHIWVNGSVAGIRQVDIPAEVLSQDDKGTVHRLRVRVEGNTYTTWIDGTQVDQWTAPEGQRNPTGEIGFRSGDTAEASSWGNVEVTDLGGEVLWTDDFDTGSSVNFPDETIEDGFLRLRGSSGVSLLQPASPKPEAPMFRKEFDVDPDKEVASARAYAYGLGWYELRMNGAKVGDEVLAPSAAQFNQRNLYRTYDVTELLQGGENAVGIWLADGYGKGYSQFGWRWTGPRQAIVAIDVTYTDGTTARIGSDQTWRWADSPVTRAHIYHGEDYDARREQDGWDSPGHDDAQWSPVAAVAAPSPRLVADEAPPVRVTKTLEPVRTYEPEPDVFVFDLGQNIAGWTRLTVKGEAGTQVTLRHSENIHEDGSLDPWTNRAAEATDRYTLAGDPEGETWEPRFTYHGFRYVEVTGLSEPPTVEGRAIHADLDVIGSFESSDAMLDQIYENNRWTILNNMMSFPTDTPVRDERTPPAMDVQAHQDASIRDLDTGTYFRKYLEDIESSTGGDSTMNGVQVPLAWELYQEYGDRQVLDELWPSVRRRADWLLTNYPDGAWPDTQGSHADGRFGDWCAPLPADQVNGGLGDVSVGNCFSEPNVVSSALQFRQVDVARRIAETLGHAEDAARYEAAAEAVKQRFNERFLNDDGSYDSGRQTTSILPLVFGMVPDDKLDLVTDYFVERVVEADEGHLDTGIFGTRYVIDALVDAGRADVALAMLQKTTYPSFGYQIVEHDATTAWEGWPLKSSMHTHDHAMFVGINASFLTRFAGIRSSSPGYETVTIAPTIPEGLERVDGSIDTVRGLVRSSWQRAGEVLTLTATLPANSTGEVHLPATDAAAVEAPEGATLERVEDGAVVYSVGSGTYEFRVGDGGSPGAGESSVTAAPVSGTYGRPTTVVARVRGGEVDPTGTVSLLHGARTLASARVRTGTAAIRLPRTSLPAGVHRLRVRYSGDTSLEGSESVVRVRIRKAPTTLRASAPQRVRPGTRPKVVVRVSSTGVRPSGVVRVLKRGRVVRSGTLNAAGRAVLWLPRQPRGATRFVVRFGPRASFHGSSDTITIRVRR